MSLKDRKLPHLNRSKDCERTEVYYSNLSPVKAPTYEHCSHCQSVWLKEYCYNANIVKNREFGNLCYIRDLSDYLNWTHMGGDSIYWLEEV